MSDSLPKPTSVEVGQWWRESDEPDEKPVRIIALEGASPYNKAGPWAIYTNGAVPQQSLLCSGEYLGSGENPEPSEWMIETLLAHAKDVAPCGMINYDARDVRHILSGGTTSSYDPREGAAMNRSVLSLYRILRSLEKW